MKDIRLRIKSVESTMQITKAMELVASSKLRKAMERLDRARPFFDLVYETMTGISASNKEFGSVFIRERPVKKALYVVIAGDRGLAGGYNANVLKHAAAVMEGQEAIVAPLGKKSVDYFTRHGYEILEAPEQTVEAISLDDCFLFAEILCKGFRNGDFDEVYFVYSGFKTMLSQEPAARKVLPLSFEKPETGKAINYTVYDPSSEEVFDLVAPQYLAGLLYGAICESFASEQGARRTAMESATDNAQEMIGNLNLMYNRARQSAITQEITEIVSGANALS